MQVLQGALLQRRCRLVSSHPLSLAWPQIWPSPVKGPGRAYHCSTWDVLLIYQTCLARTMLIPSGWTWFCCKCGVVETQWRAGWTSSQKNCHPTSISSTSISTSILQHTKRFLLMRTSHNNNREQMVLQRIDLNCVTSIFFCFFLFFLLFVESVAKPSSWSFHFSPVCRQGKTDLDPLLCFASNFLFLEICKFVKTICRQGKMDLFLSSREEK